MSCRWTTKEPYLGYDCLIFHDPSGDAWAAGTFALVEGGGSDGLTTQLSGPFAGGKIVALSGYDGERIFLANGRVLVPHIEVSYSSGNGHGRKVRYEFGKDLQETPF